MYMYYLPCFAVDKNRRGLPGTTSPGKCHPSLVFDTSPTIEFYSVIFVDKPLYSVSYEEKKGLAELVPDKPSFKMTETKILRPVWAWHGSCADWLCLTLSQQVSGKKDMGSKFRIYKYSGQKKVTFQPKTSPGFAQYDQNPKLFRTNNTVVQKIFAPHQ